jgi:hypothetical protein
MPGPVCGASLVESRTAALRTASLLATTAVEVKAVRADPFSHTVSVSDRGHFATCAI